MQHLERAVAGVDDVAVLEDARRRRARDLADHRHAGRRHRVDQELGDVVAGVAVGAEHGLAVVLGDERRLLRRGEHLPLRRDGSLGRRTRTCRRRDRSARASLRRAPRGRARARRGARSAARPSDVSMTRSRLRPRTCQTLHRSSGWTCGSVISVTPSLTGPHDPPGIGDRQLSEIGHRGTMPRPRAQSQRGRSATSSRSCCRSSGRRSSCPLGSSGRRTACRSERRSPGSSARPRAAVPRG